MTVRIALTSCADPLDARVQPVWNRIAADKPDHLVLLGDQIYMDYGFWWTPWLTANPAQGEPAGYGPLQFAQAMHARYAAQWRILRDSRLARVDGLRIHGLWDDHDFAWDDAYGDGGSCTVHGISPWDEPVPQNKQRIARRLMRQFFDALAEWPDAYPANPFTDDAVPASIDLTRPMVCSGRSDNAVVDLGHHVRLLLTDGRTWRSAPTALNRTVFGEAQWRWLGQQMAGRPDDRDVFLLASGSALSKGSDSLDRYGDYQRLLQAVDEARARVLCLTGDLHELWWLSHGPRVWEAVSSGAARPGHGLEGAYGLLTIDDATIAVRLVAPGRTPIERTLDRDTWRER